MSDLVVAIDACRAKARQYLAGRIWRARDTLYWRHSATHDPALAPAHLLYGTWAGAFATWLLEGPDGLTPEDRAAAGRALQRFQRPDGTFVMLDAGAQPADEYDVFHYTNYAWGALRLLGLRPALAPTFLDPFLDEAALAAWLARRDLVRPWREGNNIVNLGSFYASLREDGCAEAGERLDQMLDWHRRVQHPETGLWHVKAKARTAALQYAMAGGAHNLHLFYHAGQAVPQADRIIDTCLRLRYRGVSSACLDLDIVDILSHLRRYGHRVEAIDRLLIRSLVGLLQVQNPDGGFCDNYVAAHVLLGDTTPAGWSVTWATWFRLVTIGMIACTLMPSERGRWRFRNTLGSGYYNAAFAAGDGVPASSGSPPLASASTRLIIAVHRELRWSRQRVTSRLRRLLGGARA